MTDITTCKALSSSTFLLHSSSVISTSSPPSPPISWLGCSPERQKIQRKKCPTELKLTFLQLSETMRMQAHHCRPKRCKPSFHRHTHTCYTPSESRLHPQTLHLPEHILYAETKENIQINVKKKNKKLNIYFLAFFVGMNLVNLSLRLS